MDHLSYIFNKQDESIKKFNEFMQVQNAEGKIKDLMEKNHIKSIKSFNNQWTTKNEDISAILDFMNKYNIQEVIKN